jgi:hypothetical protein
VCADDNSKQKALLDRRMAMLSKLGQRGYAVSEELGGYRVSGKPRQKTGTDHVFPVFPGEQGIPGPGKTRKRGLSLFFSPVFPRNLFGILMKIL